jgi:hypothetical protein
VRTSGSKDNVGPITCDRAGQFIQDKVHPVEFMISADKKKIKRIGRDLD